MESPITNVRRKCSRVSKRVELSIKRDVSTANISVVEAEVEDDRPVGSQNFALLMWNTESNYTGKAFALWIMSLQTVFILIERFLQ